MNNPILAIDASSETCSVAYVQGNSSIQRVCAEPRTHAAQLLPMVDSIVLEAGISLETVDAIAFGAGPGSFTGLRIALSIAQGLAFGSGKPLIPVESLQAMAFYCNKDPSFKKHSHAEIAICLLDARMDEFYLAAYQLGEGIPNVVLPAQLCRYDDLEQKIAVLPKQVAIGIGAGWSLVESAVCSQLLDCDHRILPMATPVAQLGALLFHQGLAVSAETAEPIYLRNSVSWNKRKRIR